MFESTVFILAFDTFIQKLIHTVEPPLTAPLDNSPYIDSYLIPSLPEWNTPGD